MRKFTLFRLMLCSLFFTAILTTGCVEVKKQPQTPAEHFNATQSTTQTPYGNVTDGSAIDSGDGSITFATDEGITLTVSATQTANGYHYGTPRRMPDSKPEHKSPQ